MSYEAFRSRLRVKRLDCRNHEGFLCGEGDRERVELAAARVLGPRAAARPGPLVHGSSPRRRAPAAAAPAGETGAGRSLEWTCPALTTNKKDSLVKEFSAKSLFTTFRKKHALGLIMQLPGTNALA
jgi:hypothetical protein